MSLAARVRAAVLGAGLPALLVVTTRCASPTEIVVDVYTEVDCGKNATATMIVGPTLASLRTNAVTSTLSACAPSTQRSGRIVLSPTSDRDASIAFQLATRNDGEDPERTCTAASSAGCILARRQLRFVPGASTRVDVALRLSCLDKPCAPEETCRNGACEGASLPEGCLGAACLDAPAAEGSPNGDGGTASDGGDPAAVDGGPPVDGGGNSATLPELVDVPQRVYTSSDPAYRVRGLAPWTGGLYWVETSPQANFAPRLGKAAWEALATPEMPSVLFANADVGVTIDSNGGNVTVGRTGPFECAQILSGGTIDCALAFGTKGGIARWNGVTYLAGRNGPGDPALAWFSGGTVLDGSCDLPVNVALGYAKAESTSLYFTTGLSVTKVPLPLSSGGTCPVGTAVMTGLSGAKGLAVAPASELVCAGHPAGIDCLLLSTGTTSSFARAKPPTDDLAMRVVGARRYVYYAAGSEIWVVRVL